MRKIIFSTPDCTSLRFNSRASNSGPRSETVARTGWPFSPKISHTTTGLACGCQSFTPIFLSLASSFSEDVPSSATPVKSPFTSAINTGTPISDNDSASFCSVTVLPVPVAPVISPWRLAIPGSKNSSVSGVRAFNRGSLMRFPPVSCLEYRQRPAKRICVMQRK